MRAPMCRLRPLKWLGLGLLMWFASACGQATGLGEIGGGVPDALGIGSEDAGNGLGAEEEVSESPDPERGNAGPICKVDTDCNGPLWD